MKGYEHFRLLDSSFDLDNVYKVTIDLKSYLGDADLYVSTSADNTWPNSQNFTYASRRKDHFDRVQLTDTVHKVLASEIYIAVRGATYAEYELLISVDYHPTQNEKLEKAFALTDQRSVFHKVENTKGEAFYSFRPWWSMHEQKTIVMLADSPQHEVVFYVDLDDYPKVYATDWLATNGMFALQPWSPGYSDANELFGSFYIRVRPVYNLADLVIDMGKN